MPGGGKVRGYSTHLYTGRLRPDVRPLTLLCTISERKGIPFVYLPLTNLTPLKYLAQNYAFVFTAVNLLSLKII